MAVSSGLRFGSRLGGARGGRGRAAGKAGEVVAAVGDPPPGRGQRLRRPALQIAGLRRVLTLDGLYGYGGKVAGIDLFAVDRGLVAVGSGIASVLAAVAAVAAGVVAVAERVVAVSAGGALAGSEVTHRVVEIVEKGVDSRAVEAGQASLLGGVGVESGQRGRGEVEPVGVVEGGVLDTGQPVQDLQADALDAVVEVIGGAASVVVALVGVGVALVGGVVADPGDVVAAVGGVVPIRGAFVASVVRRLG